MIVVEKGIELPKGRIGQQKYPWDEMDIGDSFYVAGGDLKRIRWAATANGSKYGRKYSVRAVDGGVRTWRVA